MSNVLGKDVWAANDVRILRSPLVPHATGSLLQTSGTAIFSYMGFCAEAVTPKYVQFLVRTAGAGAQTCEVGIYTSPLAPNRTTQTMTKVEATGTVDSVTSTGLKQNSSAFTTEVAAGSHIWAGFRVAMATTQPRLLPIIWEGGNGLILLEAGASALTATSSNSPSLAGTGDLNLAAELRITLD